MFSCLEDDFAASYLGEPTMEYLSALHDEAWNEDNWARLQTMSVVPRRQQTRDEVYLLAKHEHFRHGAVENVVPRNYPDTDNEFGLPIFNFYIRYNDTPHRRNVVTYGPQILFERGKLADRIGYVVNQYCCYAS
jgi:hypothetical protein